MPRRNQRAEQEAFAADVILGDDYKFTRDPEEAARRRQRRRERADKARRNFTATLRDQWTQCMFDGCKFQVPKKLKSGIEAPICTAHAVAIWMDVEARADDPAIMEATAALRARRKAEIEEWEQDEAESLEEYRRDLRAGVVSGDIYFIRANGLVKVGWSADVESRLKSYGPGIEVLCVYAGTRKDETALHRQLTPSRAKGREWYHEDEIIRAFVADAVAEHGAPKVAVSWSAPATVVAGKRVHRR